MKIKTCGAVLLSALGAATLPGQPSLAQSQGEPHRQLAPAWEQSDELLDAILTPAQHTVLNDLAFAAAVANFCEGFDLSREAFTNGFQELEHEAEADMSPDEVRYFEQHLLFNYGVAVGLFMAEGALDPVGFCQQAQEHMEDPEAIHFWES